MSGRSPEEREQARRDREIRRLERAGEPVPPELREPVRPATPPPPIAASVLSSIFVNVFSISSSP